MQVTWLGHGTFQFRLPSGQVILMDPWTDGNPKFPKGYEIERVDTICITHGHFDHIHDAVPLATRFKPEVVAIFETCNWLESKGVENTRPMNKGGSQKVGEVVVTMTHAVHSCGILDDGKIIYGGEACGYVIRLPGGLTVYHAGDTAYFPGFSEIGRRLAPELALLPIGAYNPPQFRNVHTNPADATRAFLDLKSRWMVPMHYGSFRLSHEPVDEPLQLLEEEARAAGIEDRVVVMEEGVTRFF